MEAKTLSKLMDTGEWQEKVRQFISPHIHYCASMLVYELAQNEKYLDELIPVCISDSYIDAAYEEKNASFEDEDLAREFCEENNIDPHTVEAYEHWIVSDWLADKLEAKGEMVLRDFLGLTIWGRTTSGQSIYIDRVINEIYADVEAFRKKLGATNL